MQDEGQHDPANPFDPKPFVVCAVCCLVCLVSRRRQWFYQVLIENQGPVPVQLVSRLWHMFDGQGNQDKICGPGVVGVMPILSDASPSFQYVSSITMGTSSGVMGFAAHSVLLSSHDRSHSGSLTFVELLPSGVHGRTIDVSIPTFHLNSPAVVRRSLPSLPSLM
jgi:ApaG protein